MKLRNLIAVVGLSLATGASVLLIPGVASASGSYMTTAASMPPSPQIIPTWLAPIEGVFVIGAGSPVRMNCWTTGPYASGTSKWFQVTDMNTSRGYGVTGYVPATAVGGQTGVGYC